MQNIQLPSRTLALDGFSAGFLPARSTIDSGMIFLEGELEKRDDRLREPLASVTWPRDIPCARAAVSSRTWRASR